MKGKTAGKFDVSLALDYPDEDGIRVESPATEQMGVVELQMKLHQQDEMEIKKIEIDPNTDPLDTYYTALKDQVIPDQKEMTDEEKIKVGRLLHVQKDGNFGRAKLVCKKLESRDWPAGTDDYEIVIKQEIISSGGLELFDAEWDGAKKEFPGTIKFADIKAEDQVFWVQGKFFTKKSRDAHLYLGIDRPSGGLPKKTKRNGDWACFTVVDIKEIKVEYTAEDDRAVAWDQTQKRFYVNLGATWNARKKEFKTDNNTDLNGRKITISAQLGEKLKNVPIYFMLAPDKDNRKAANWGKDMPATWKWKDLPQTVKHRDKAHHKKFLHLSALTDDNGYAKMELGLSRFGGDVFWPACYIGEDPHLAKYVDGHADLEKRKPAMAVDSVSVWKKFWYQEVRVAGLNVAGFGDAADTYSDVKTEMIAAPVVEMTRQKADKIRPRIIYPKHMISFYLNPARTAYVNNYPNDAGDGLVVGDATEARFWPLAKPVSDKPVMIPILNAHALWVKDGLTSSDSVPWFNASNFPVDFSADKDLLDPPLQGGTLLKSGRWTAEDQNPTTLAWENRRSGRLKAADLALDPGRSAASTVQIKKPSKLKLKAGVLTRVRITGLTLRGAESFLGTSYDNGIINSYTPNDEQDFINTINHEIGHSLKQVPSRPNADGNPDHQHWYLKDGDHCKYTNKSCLMYESGPQPASLNRYCPVCHPYVLVQDMTKV